jgi:hypothetical protein
MRTRFASEAVEGGTTESGVTSDAYSDMFTGPDHSFLYWLKAGLAFTLPLLLLGLIAVFIFCWKSFAL